MRPTSVPRGWRREGYDDLVAAPDRVRPGCPVVHSARVRRVANMSHV
ncbi:hypothetical protein RND61_14555 [Streptomyces sp. TRM76323]|uniref:Uncharacterized protein n=1 Tax=Streptomyces tamarix TaxID=3078565 RepID=A0ABU3QKJ0_9ACTN|nr:hypothetical protein [Streptomyces tamarix]MDT9683283.1 hypothetical protein [Streptomyces tamarix]